MAGMGIAPPQWLKPVQNRGKYFWTVRLISKICPRIITSKIVFLESVTFQLHTRMLNSQPAQSLKSYGHFSDLRVEIALRHRHAVKRRFFRVKRIQQSTASERTTRLGMGIASSYGGGGGWQRRVVKDITTFHQDWLIIANKCVGA